MNNNKHPVGKPRAQASSLDAQALPADAAMQYDTFPEPIKPLHKEKATVKVACIFAEQPMAVLKKFEGRVPGVFWCKYCQMLLRDEGQVADHIQGRKHARSKRRTRSIHPMEGIEFEPDLPTLHHLYQ